MNTFPPPPSDPTWIPSVQELSSIVAQLGGTPRKYMPNGAAMSGNETFATAALATAMYGHAAKVAHKAQAELVAQGAHIEATALNHLLTVAIEEGDGRSEAVPLLWFWQAAAITTAMDRETARAPHPDPLLRAGASTARALAHLLEARLAPHPERTSRLEQLLAEAEQLLANARADASQVPR